MSIKPKLNRVTSNKGRPCDYQMSHTATGMHLCVQYDETLENIKSLVSSFREVNSLIPKTDPVYRDGYDLMLEREINGLPNGVKSLKSKRLLHPKWKHLFSITKNRTNIEGSHTIKSVFQDQETKKIALITSCRKDGPDGVPRCKMRSGGSDLWICYNTKMQAPLYYWELLIEKMTPPTIVSPLARLTILESFFEINHGSENPVFIDRIKELEKQAGIDEPSDYFIQRLLELEKLCVLSL